MRREVLEVEREQRERNLGGFCLKEMSGEQRLRPVRRTGFARAQQIRFTGIDLGD
jgi:hypothetical protein